MPGFVLLVLVEIVVARIRDRTRYEPNDTLTSLALGLGSTIAGILTGGLFLAIALWFYQYRLFDIGYTWWAFVLAFVLDDLGYYWIHRAGHRIRWAWAAHVVHHSSQHYNLSTALRQTWTGFFGLTFIIKLPLFLVGFPPAMLAFVGGINLIYQFWIHTEVIGRMPRWFEAVMNTPSHHRVHHATNPRYLDMNYAGVFIVWDKMFGTFTPELDEEQAALRHRQESGQLQPRLGGVPRMDRDREGRVGGADAEGQMELHGQAAGLEPRRQPRDDRESIKALWEQRERESAEWKKPTSSSSGADRAAPPQRDGSARTAATR